MKFLLWKLINKVIKSSSFYVSLCFFLTISLTFFSEVPISCWVFKKSHFKWFFNNTVITINSFFQHQFFTVFLSQPWFLCLKCMFRKRSVCRQSLVKQTVGLWRHEIPQKVLTTQFFIAIWLIRPIRLYFFFCMPSKNQGGNLVLFISIFETISSKDFYLYCSSQVRGYHHHWKSV